jgi:hypothetical protein
MNDKIDALVALVRRIDKGTLARAAEGLAFTVDGGQQPTDAERNLVADATASEWGAVRLRLERDRDRVNRESRSHDHNEP